jgi:hypothetical protein
MSVGDSRCRAVRRRAAVDLTVERRGRGRCHTAYVCVGAAFGGSGFGLRVGGRRAGRVAGLGSVSGARSFTLYNIRYACSMLCTSTFPCAHYGNRMGRYDSTYFRSVRARRPTGDGDRRRVRSAPRRAVPCVRPCRLVPCCVLTVVAEVALLTGAVGRVPRVLLRSALIR